LLSFESLLVFKKLEKGFLLKREVLEEVISWLNGRDDHHVVVNIFTAKLEKLDKDKEKLTNH
jgi:hypothetical protein